MCIICLLWYENVTAVGEKKKKAHQEAELVCTFKNASRNTKLPNQIL